jgi:hypothetical protein
MSRSRCFTVVIPYSSYYTDYVGFAPIGGDKPTTDGIRHGNH